jgi:hypothetical protein
MSKEQNFIRETGKNDKNIRWKVVSSEWDKMSNGIMTYGNNAERNKC